jgi:hypothetical protein
MSFSFDLGNKGEEGFLTTRLQRLSSRNKVTGEYAGRKFVKMTEIRF